MRWRLSIIATGVLAALLLVACGEGGGNTEPTPTPEPEPQVAVSCAAIRDISSYRYTISIQLDIPAAPTASGEIEPALSADNPLGAFAPILFGLLSDLEIEGAFVAPDRSQAILTAGSEEVEVRTIDGQSWVRFGDVWREETSPRPEVLLSPDTICEDILPDLGRSLTGLDLDYQPQIVNGVATRHYHLDEANVGQLEDLFDGGETGGDLPQRSTLDVWLAEEGGWPLQVKLTASGKDEEGRPVAASVIVKFWDMNSPDIEIEPPPAVGEQT